MLFFSVFFTTLTEHRSGLSHLQYTYIDPLSTRCRLFCFLCNAIAALIQGQVHGQRVQG